MGTAIVPATENGGEAELGTYAGLGWMGATRGKPEGSAFAAIASRSCVDRGGNDE